MAVRITQEPLEALAVPESRARATQAAAEALGAPSGTRGRATQAAAEALGQPTTSAGRFTQAAVEVLVPLS